MDVNLLLVHLKNLGNQTFILIHSCIKQNVKVSNIRIPILTSIPICFCFTHSKKSLGFLHRLCWAYGVIMYKHI